MRQGLALALVLFLVVTPGLAGQRVPWQKLKVDSLIQATMADSDDALAQYHIAVAFIGHKRYDKADGVLRRAIRLAPHDANIRLAFGALPALRGAGAIEQLARRLGRDSTASLLHPYAESLHLAFILDPGVDLTLLKGKVDRILPPEPVLDVDGIRIYENGWWYGPLHKAVKALLAGDAAGAYTRLDAVLASKEFKAGRYLPSGFIWWYAISAFHLQRYDRAVAALLTLEQRATDHEALAAQVGPFQARADYDYLLATGQLLRGSLDQADSAYRETLGLDAGMFMAHEQLARIAESRGDWAGAVAERERAVSANPDDAALYCDLGETLLRAGRAEAAESAFVQATELNPSDPHAWYLFGVTAQGNGHGDAARAALDRFIAVAPSRLSDDVEDARMRLTHLQAPAQ